MKLWLILQDVNNTYDYFDSAVVAAETEEAARNTQPDGNKSWAGAWAIWAEKPEQVTVRLIGEAPPDTEPGVILASFNAG